MTQPTTVGKRGSTGRADLLRVLAATASQGADARKAFGTLLGYELRRPTLPKHKRPAAHRPTQAAPTPAPPAGSTHELRSAMFGAAWLASPPEARTTTSVPAETLAPLSNADWGPEPSAPLPPKLPPIVPRSRVLPALERALRVATPGGIDIPRLVSQLAALRLPAHLPRRASRRCSPRWILVLDPAGALGFYAQDMVQLLQWAERHCGTRSSSVRVLADAAAPLVGWLPIPGPRNGAAEQLPMHVQAWEVPASDARILIVSDLGLADAKAPQLSNAWLAWLGHMQSGGAQLQVWSPLPLSAPASTGPMAQLPVLHWSAAAPLRTRPLRQGAPHRTPAREQAAQALVAQLAFAPYIDATLLRLMRLAAGDAAKDAGLEHLAWHSPDLTPGRSSCRMRADQMEKHRTAFAALPAAQQQRTQDVAVGYYRTLSQPLVHMHSLAWSTRAATFQQQAAVEHAQKFARRLVAQPLSASAIARDEVAIFLANWFAQADATELRAHHTVHAMLDLARQRLRVQQGAISLPEALPHSAMAAAMGTQREATPWWLVHNIRTGDALLVREPPAGTSLLWPQPMMLRSADLQRGDAPRRQWLELAGQSLVLGPMQAPHPMRLRTATGSLHLSEIKRPRGVVSWWRDGRGLHLSGTALGTLALDVGPEKIVLAPPTGGADDHRLRVIVPPQRTAHPHIRFGIDPEHGLYLDFDIAGRGISASATQRLRWIEPGEFWMGSDAAERRLIDNKDHERWADARESPRHRVRISQGFWLADSACSQQFWGAVMGDRPSHFKGDPSLPVEQVSFGDVQRFMARLQQHLPGDVLAALPSEAQWEYACRAGTTTAFSFGDVIDDTQVSHRAGGAFSARPSRAGLDRPVPVKSLPANPWGLHEMHGNLWEWCADPLRDYEQTALRDAALVDPVGTEPSPGAHRAVRGGAWWGPARYCRSAYRSGREPGYRSLILGFRLSLRSTSPVQEGPGTGAGAVDGVPEARRSARRDAGPKRKK
jgi:formylglycine-generating enzyme required for sulfatase activity